MPPVLLCDLDGTLVDTIDDLAAALNRSLAEQGLATLPTDTVRRFVGQGASHLVARALAATGAPASESALSAQVARFLAHYDAAPAVHSRPYDGVAATLRRLRGAGWRLGVCTNKPQASSEALLRAMDLLPLFEIVAGGDRFPVHKPDGGHLHATLAAMRATAGGAVLVGDSRSDVAAGRTAGVPVILVDYGYADRPAVELGGDAVVSDFTEVPAVLAGLTGAGARS